MCWPLIYRRRIDYYSIIAMILNVFLSEFFWFLPCFSSKYGLDCDEPVVKVGGSLYTHRKLSPFPKCGNFLNGTNRSHISMIWRGVYHLVCQIAFYRNMNLIWTGIIVISFNPGLFLRIYMMYGLSYIEVSDDLPCTWFIWNMIAIMNEMSL